MKVDIIIDNGDGIPIKANLIDIPNPSSVFEDLQQMCGVDPTDEIKRHLLVGFSQIIDRRLFSKGGFGSSRFIKEIIEDSHKITIPVIADNRSNEEKELVERILG